MMHGRKRQYTSGELHQIKEAGEKTLEKYTDYGCTLVLQKELDSFERRWELLSEISDDLEYVFGNDWRSIFERYEEKRKESMKCEERMNLWRGTPSHFVSTYSPLSFSSSVWAMASGILLARRGLIGERMGFHTYVLRYSKDLIITEAQKEDLQRKRRWVTVIEKHLKKAHPENSSILVRVNNPGSDNEEYALLSYLRATQSQWNFPAKLPNYDKEQHDEIVEACEKMNEDHALCGGNLAVKGILFIGVLFAIMYVAVRCISSGDLLIQGVGTLSTIPAVIASAWLILGKLNLRTDPNYQDW